MRLFVLSLVICLALLVTTAWLIITPVYAATATASCGPGGGTISCTGTNCTSVDAPPGGFGGCGCTSSNGGTDTKTCSYIPLADLPY